jgi:hemerythrin
MTAEVTGKRAPFVVEWRDGFKVSIPQIDFEHRHLFALVKALNLQSVERTLEELLSYVVTHFTNEQALMEESRYPMFEEHLQLHETFSTFVADFLAESDSWNEERIQELRRFLNKWLIGHILTHDMRFGNWYGRNRSVNARSAQEKPDSQRGFIAKVFGIK